MLRYPHLILFAPSVIRPPHFQSDCVFAAGLGNENSFSRMGNLSPGNDHDFFGNALVDENTITLAHSGSVFPFAFRIHAPKVSLANSSGKLHFQPMTYEYRPLTHL